MFLFLFKLFWENLKVFLFKPSNTTNSHNPDEIFVPSFSIMKKLEFHFLSSQKNFALRNCFNSCYYQNDEWYIYFNRIKSWLLVHPPSKFLEFPSPLPPSSRISPNSQNPVKKIPLLQSELQLNLFQTF